MVRLTLLVVCLVFYYAPNLVVCETWGDIAEKLDLDQNVAVKLVNNNTVVKQEIPGVFSVSVNNQNDTKAANADDKSVNITVKTTTPAKIEIPKFVTYQPRIVAAAAPKAGAAGATVTQKPAAGGAGAAVAQKPAAGAAGAAVTQKPAAAPNAAGPKTITYKLGARVAGDHVIATTSLSQQWAAAQNVTQTLTYPKAGVGSVITYVEVIVDQSMNLGKAFVTNGSIGQRQISLTIEALKTLYFRQNTQIYGY